MKHGNILVLFEADEVIKTSVELIVSANATNYKQFNNLFFIATPDIDKAENIVNELNNLQVVFIFYFNNISTGSAVLANIGNPNKALIENILI